ncbi:MAG TPA: poly-beta-hydroxybutyrate polymerase N-terminal domain-containing protein, partial [Pseudogulbenkiania sp.]|nr:poly-beta-hydroxybutyrate polymerase N-terminal domain-containing protein [Pseudogulbenkiania sp.]
MSEPGPADEDNGPTSVDRLLRANLGRATLGISPASLALAYFDW